MHSKYDLATRETLIDWLEEAEAEINGLQAKLDKIKQISDFPSQTKEMAGYNSLIWKILEGEG